MLHYDAIVLGTGGVGSAAAMHLAQRGRKVLGLDRFPAGHDRGSSHGETRIIRQAYFEHPDYVPLLKRAYTLWAELAQQVQQQLFWPVGLLQVGPTQGPVVQGVLDSSRQHGLDVQQLSPQEAMRQFPGAIVPPGMVGVYEAEAGYLKVESCVLAHLQTAQAAGAELVTGITVQNWRSAPSGVIVNTDQGPFSADRLVITAGPWAPQILADLNIPLEVRRKQVYWFETTNAHFRADQGFPTFLYDLPEGCFYGFPVIDELGLKVAEHSGGTHVENPLTDPRLDEPAALARVQQFLAKALPETRPPCGTLTLKKHSVCYYTMSPDEHFLVDQHPHDPRVVLAAGLSGHGFKFAGVLGQILADLALDGGTSLPAQFLRISRFAP